MTLDSQPHQNGSGHTPHDHAPHDEDDVPSPIFRHEAREREFEPAFGDEESLTAIGDHIERHIGPIETVFHELLSDMVHVDVHVVAPVPGRNFYTLVTSGMSDRPMTAPEEALQYAELMICLPPDWPLGQSEFQNEDNYWPIRWLKKLARLPHEYETWLGFGHTVPNGDPAEPFASNTQLCCMLLVPPVQAPEEFQELEISPDKTIIFYSLVPLYKEEMELKIRKGTEKLFELFDQHGVSEVLEVNRPNVCPKKRWFFG